jgi:Protein of unknown function (DUF2874).
MRYFILKHKRIIIISISVLAAIGLFVLTLDVYNDDRIIDKNGLPESITNFINSNFPGTGIRSAEIDFLDYSVWLDDDTYIEFDWDRNWDQVARYNSQPVPSSLIPNNILSFVKNKYPGSIITEISKDDSRYEIKISDHFFELIFNKQGEYIGIDD